ncbi:MAG TPA: FecR domain-containing protein, partial [Chitinophagaceae bacterium]|nr:FecR domain-containing protein [Chitinophagaceae bacterium]
FRALSFDYASNTNCMSQEQFWILLTRKIAGEASPEDLAELEKLVQQHPEWQYALQNLEDIWNSHPPTDLSEEEDAYLIHLHRMQEKNIPFGNKAKEDEAAVFELETPRSNKRRRLAWITAGIAVAVSVAAIFFFKPVSRPGKKEIASINEISTRLGSKTRIQLPDGSIVWLNAGSKLIYDKNFGKEERLVSLSGEGFFDVVRDPSKPFIVHTTNIEVRVLGTVFNVKAYPEDKSSETSLIHGSLEVSIKSRPRDKIILSSNEKLVVENKISSSRDSLTEDRDLPLMTLNQIKHNPLDNSVNETQWIDNKLVFDNEPFADIAVKMERWFGVEIEIADSSLAEKRMTGKFERENIEQALESLSYASTTSFVFERKGNKIIIHH